MNTTILGQHIDPLTQAQALERIVQSAQAKQKLAVATVNPEMLMAAQSGPQFATTLKNFDLRLADGIGILWAANYYALASNTDPQPLLKRWVNAVSCGLKTIISQSYRTALLPQQVTGSDLSLKLAEKAAELGLSMFLLGGFNGVAQEAADNLKKRLPTLLISGVFEGDGSPAGDAEVQSIIAQHPADIILVAYGAGKQEWWIERNLEHIPVSVAIGVGGTLDFIAGRVRRAPVFMQNLGLEWLWRLTTQPWRAKRQLALPRFIDAVVRDSSLR